MPEFQARIGVEFLFDRIDELIHGAICEAAIVLTGPAVFVIRDLLRMEGAARDIFRGRDPGKEGQGTEVAPIQRLTEEDSRRFIANTRIDAEFTPLALEYLLQEFARPVARG